MANEKPTESEMAGEGPGEFKSTAPNGGPRRIKIGGFIVLVAAIVVCIYWWVFKRNYVSTDDAYAKADSAMVSARIPGTVVQVLVDNDFAVRAGQPLIQLDPADYKVAVDRAKAALDEERRFLTAVCIDCN